MSAGGLAASWKQPACLPSCGAVVPPARARAAQAVAARIPHGFITMSKLTPKVDAQLVRLPPVHFLNPFYVRQAHAAGQITCPLDPTLNGRLWYYRWLGCDAVLANDPGPRRSGRWKAPNGPRYPCTNSGSGQGETREHIRLPASRHRL